MNETFQIKCCNYIYNMYSSVAPAYDNVGQCGKTTVAALNFVIKNFKI